MDIGKLRKYLRTKGISLDRNEYARDKRDRPIANCKCDICGHAFSRPVGELVSGNRGCPACLNVQEMHARVILAHNFGGAFQIRVRPKWLGGLELDGWNEEISIQGRTVAFEYNGRYWHRLDADDLRKTQHKRELCHKSGVILLIVRAEKDRPTWEEQLKACQTAVEEAGISKRLTLPPVRKLVDLARAIPIRIRDQLAAINHEPIEFDQHMERRGHIVSRCLLTGKVVSQELSSLKAIRGCTHCQSHHSRSEFRRANASHAARTGWQLRRKNGQRRVQDKITDEIVAYIRSQAFETDGLMAEEITKRFGVKVSQSGLQYARSGKTHRHLNEVYPPVRKAAAHYTHNHAAVKLAIKLRNQGLSLGVISRMLFDSGYGTFKGTQFSATQVKNFLRLA